MNRKLSIDPEVLARARAAASYHESKRPGHGPEFREAFDDLLGNILCYPEMYERWKRRYRRAFKERFSFVVIYRVTSNAVQIVGLFRQETDPAAMKRRIVRSRKS